MRLLSAQFLSILFYFIVIDTIAIHGRLTEQDVVEELIHPSISDKDHHLAATLAAYSYRFRYSETFRNFQWTANERNYSIFCEPCDLLVPLVSRNQFLNLNRQSILFRFVY